MCMCSVLSCPLPSESPPYNEGSVRLRWETPRGPAEGPPDQGGPGGGSRVAADHQRGGGYPASGENHPGHRRARHRFAGVLQVTTSRSKISPQKRNRSSPHNETNITLEKNSLLNVTSGGGACSLTAAGHQRAPDLAVRCEHRQNKPSKFRQSMIYV